jgi:hypothetical protein
MEAGDRRLKGKAQNITGDRHTDLKGERTKKARCLDYENVRFEIMDGDFYK